MACDFANMGKLFDFDYILSVLIPLFIAVSYLKHDDQMGRNEIVFWGMKGKELGGAGRRGRVDKNNHK